ncbi:MAG: fused MFS/spermidine synthase [Planctomycetaceae bacterium]|nr:fused MFS/spermidine synthase [Planctomycetaceae bacterium]
MTSPSTPPQTSSYSPDRDSSPLPAPQDLPQSAFWFGLTVLLSAFLLFLIQPLISKVILPWYGGTPAVWTTCMLFFQCLLYLGYHYSHVLTSVRPFSESTRWQVLTHIVLLCATVGFLNIVPDLRSIPTSQQSPTLQILWTLTRSVGLPYFLLATTGPLLLRWFTSVCPGKSPYRLYALSNTGSLVALLSFPFLLEPFLSISSLDQIWCVTFYCFAGGLSVCIRMLFRSVAPLPRDHVSGEAAEAATSSLPSTKTVSGSGRKSAKDLTATSSFRVRLKWLSLSFLSCLALLAETNEICQDVAVIPFLWIAPLSLYLLTFILCFEHDRWYQRKLFGPLTGVLLLAVCWVQSFGARTNLIVQVSIYFSALFCIFMLCQGELAASRPAPRELTRFYLTIAAGGALAGLFAGLIAPVIFPGYWEHYLTLIGSSFLSTYVWMDSQGWTTGQRRAPLWSLGVVVALAVAIITVTASAVQTYMNSIETARSFYGVLEVEDDAVENARLLRHGRIIHGLQLKALPSVPTMYYGYRTGVGLAMDALREGKSKTLRCGFVGLGVGTMAAYGLPGDSFRFYEINPQVVEIAESRFTFLKNSAATIEHVAGDARLSLEAEPPQSYDLLVLDAFSGDAIPTHLLTQQAFEIYTRHLSDKGLIAFHVSNLHFDLTRVTDGLARRNDWQSLVIETPEIRDPSTNVPLIASPGSRWVILGKNGTLPDALAKAGESRKSSDPVLWTDDFSNLFQVLAR